MSPSPSVSPFPHAGRHLLAWRRAAAPARPPPAATRPNYGLITPRPAPFQTLPSANLICPPGPPLPLVAIPDSRTRRQRRSRVLQPRSSPSVPAPTCCVVLCCVATREPTATTALQLLPAQPAPINSPTGRPAIRHGRDLAFLGFLCTLHGAAPWEVRTYGGMALDAVVLSQS